MTKITSYDLTPFYRNTVGLDRLFDRIVSQVDSAAATNYPPYNIEKVAENFYDIVVAVSGFKKNEITVEVEGDQLTIRGEKPATAEPDPEYLHRGLAFRDFERRFTLAEHMEVINAEVQNGLLTVQIERKIPESARAKKITISYQPDTAE